MPDPTPLQDRLARIAHLREHLATLEGHAESPDGLIKVTCTTDEPLYELYLHPRALNLLNADLAEAIQRTATEARQDLKTHTDEALATLLPPGDPAAAIADPAAARARLTEMADLMRATTEDTRTAFDRLRAQFGR
jgi:DNA-binding protein YbaB